MSGSLTKRKRGIPQGANRRFGHCMPTTDLPERLDSEQHKKCQGSFVAHKSSLNWKKGDTITCQCPCHGEVAEAWPGADASAAEQLQEAPGDETTEGTEVPVTEQPEVPTEQPVAAEPPLPALT